MATPEVRLKPTDIVVKKWADRAKAGVELYREFTRTPKRDPTAAAVAMKESLIAKMSARETWDKWESRLRNVGFNGWLYGVQTKGVQRFPQGIDAGVGYFEQFYQQFSRHLAAGLAQVYSMPKRTLEDSINRAAAMIRHNAKFKFQKRPLTAGT